MAIDFTFPPEVEEIRFKVRDFIQGTVKPLEQEIEDSGGDRKVLVKNYIRMRELAKEAGLWLPHMPEGWGGMGLGHVAMAAVSAEAARTRFGPSALNAQAPDEGNMHTLLHWGTDEQKQKYLKPLCDGFQIGADGKPEAIRSCFAMTEPEVAGSDPTLIQTKAYKDGEEWVINGHKWFISGARGATFAILIAKTNDEPDNPRAGNTAFIVDLPSEGWNIVRDVETLSGSHNHCEILIEDLRVHESQMLGGEGQGHLLGQYRLGPARLAHCMRWIGQAETALEMMVDRALNRYAHGSLLAEKQGIQWMIADSTMELYQCKLMVLHAASLIDASGNDPSVVDFRGEVSMAKHFVANSLWRIVDRAVQVHGALGYSSDTPLGEMLKQARWSRFADGADEVHQWRIAERTISDWKDNQTVKNATGKLPL
ncbi:MAG TPA: acyl-CoA dehydrogenase family protein [Acidimicrobiales bacterium]|nr:acyl-CoA dehydrogenase family protein [Acidimicrobiales bacterium]